MSPCSRSIARVHIKLIIFRVGQRLAVLHRRPCTTSRTASSVILPLRCAGCRPPARSFAGTWRGVQPCGSAHLMRARERVVERVAARLQLHEEHDAHVALPVLADHHALQHLQLLLDLAVDLGRADAHAAGVEHRVGAAVDDDAVVLGELGDSRRGTRCRGSARSRRRGSGCRRGRSRSRRHRGEGPVQTSSPFSPRTGRPSSSNTSTAMPRPRTGSRRARPGRRVAEDEAGDDVGAAGDRGEQRSLLDVAVDEVEASRRRAASRSRASPQAAERSWVFARLAPGLVERVDVLGRGAEDVIPPRRRCRRGCPSGVERRAVVEQQRGLGSEAETSQFHIIQPQVVK
jgi:hypothetical protein